MLQISLKILAITRGAACLYINCNLRAEAFAEVYINFSESEIVVWTMDSDVSVKAIMIQCFSGFLSETQSVDA